MNPQLAPMAREVLFFQARMAALAGDLDGAGGVAGAAAVEMRREQGVTLRAREEGLFTGDFDVHQDDRVVGVGDELLGDGVAALEVGGFDAEGECVGVDVVEVVLEVDAFLHGRRSRRR